MNPIQTAKRVFLNVVPTYKRLELRQCTRDDADDLLRRCGIEKGDEYGWRIAKEEDKNRNPAVVFVEKVERLRA